jgi:hypothetical protein
MTPPARAPGQRKLDALDRLDHDIDACVATAGPGNGAPHAPSRSRPGAKPTSWRAGN